MLVGEDCSVHICGPPTPEHCCKTVLTPRGRRFWPQHLEYLLLALCLVELGGLYFFHIISLYYYVYYYVSFSLFRPALFSIFLLLLHRYIPLHRLLPAAIISLAEQILLSTFYCLPKTFIVRSVGGLSCFICARELRQLARLIR